MDSAEIPLRTRSGRVGMAVATGMVSAQVDCSVETAAILIHRRAELIGCNMANVASAVIDRRMRFERPAPMAGLVTPPA